MDFISFGNNGQLAVERAEEAVRRNFLTGQHVAADVAEVFVGSHVTFENVRQQSADFQLAISGFQHFEMCIRDRNTSANVVRAC